MNDVYKYYDVDIGATAKKLWREKLTYQIEFLNRLKAQVNNSNPKTLL